MYLSKSHITDIVSILVVGVGYYLPEPYHSPLLYMGLFALSGAVTNQLAIYMLFNRVPLLYGSGVIENNFQAFKSSIKNMIMEQFFTKSQIEEFFQNENRKLDLAPLVESADFKPAFSALKQSVMESKLGDALNLFGGEKALDSLEAPFNRKLKSAVVKIVSSNTFKEQMGYHLQKSSLNEDLRNSVEELITKRLEDLTPKMVNDLVHKLIHTHLGWLVIWGGVFGGLMGLLSSILF
jgi:uncharacterized membrane protein YheB (UPF0754 family)